MDYDEEWDEVASDPEKVMQWLAESGFPTGMSFGSTDNNAEEQAE